MGSSVKPARQTQAVELTGSVAAYGIRAILNAGEPRRTRNGELSGKVVSLYSRMLARVNLCYVVRLKSARNYNNSRVAVPRVAPTATRSGSGARWHATVRGNVCHERPSTTSNVKCNNRRAINAITTNVTVRK